MHQAAKTRTVRCRSSCANTTTTWDAVLAFATIAMACISCVNNRVSAFVSTSAVRSPLTASSAGASATTRWDPSRVGWLNRAMRAPVSCLRAQGGSGCGPLFVASQRGLVFPMEIEEGWFDSATVGSPRVHRCKRELDIDSSTIQCAEE